MMQQLTLNINDQVLEAALSSIARKEGKDITEVIMNAIAPPVIVRQKSSKNVKKLDPFRHSIQIQYWVSEDLSDVKPYSQVTDSAKFGKALRNRVWDRTNNNKTF